MNQTRVLILVGLALVIHAAEELFTGFYAIDPTVLGLAHLFALAPIVMWVILEALIFILFGVVYAFRSLKFFWVLLMLFMLAQLYHFVLIFVLHTYDGAISAFLFFPLLWFTYKVSPLTLFKSAEQ